MIEASLAFMLAAQAVGAQIGAVEICIGTRIPAGVISLQNQFAVREGGGEKKTEMEDTKDEGVELSGNDDPG